MVDQLESLVREIEGVAGVEEEMVGAGSEDHVGDGGRGEAEVDGGAQRALRRLRGARLHEAAEPVDVALRLAHFGIERSEVEVRGLVRGRAGDVNGPMENGQRAIRLVQLGEDVGHRCEDREPRAPAARAVAHAEERRFAQNLARRVELVQADHALCEHQRDLLLEALAQFPLPVSAAIVLDRVRVDEDLAVARLHVERRHVVGEGIERTAAGEVELRVVPVAGEDAVADRAAPQGKAHVGTAVVERVEAALVVDDEDSAPLRGDDFHAVRFDLLEGADADEGGCGGGHRGSSRGVFRSDRF